MYVLTCFWGVWKMALCNGRNSLTAQSPYDFCSLIWCCSGANIQEEKISLQPTHRTPMKNHVLSFVLASEKRAFCTNKSLINRTEIQGPLFPLQVSCLLLREGFLDYQSLSDSHTMCFFSTFSTLVLNDFYSGSLGSLLPTGIHSLWQQSSVQYLFPPLPQCGLATLHTLLPDPSHHPPWSLLTTWAWI